MFFYNDTFAFNEIAQKCFEKGAAAGHAYYNSEEYKTMIISFDDDECNNASETEKQDIRIRNICLGIIGDAKTNCEIYKCVKDNEGKIDWSFEPLLINPDLTGDEICNVANNPYFCLNDSIETLKNFLNKFGNSLYTADTMDDINTEIQNGKFNTTKIDINKAICYMADSNGNTIWHTFVISGYIPQCQASRVADHLSEHYDCEVEVEDLKPDEEAPVILKNNPFSASMEGVVESYGLPANGEIDPTTIMSFFYVFFFGMMLSDAAYGLIVAVVCGILVRKYPRMSPGMRKSLKLFFYCGISTVVWGVLFGGYFGNIVDIVTEKFLGRTITPPALWFVPLDEPMKLLLFSLLFGVIHLFTGLAIKGYLCIREGKMLDFFCDVVLWFLLLVGLLLMLLPSSLFASIAQMEIVFPGWLNTLAKVLAASGAIGIVLMSGRSNRNPALRIALGAYDLYNITGWLSDVLSYSRLLALGLATGVIASVINQMGSMLPNNLIGILFFILIFIVGHSMNLAINLLGAYVHTNRLQFVEFFGKFYEGGGRPFRPFRENTKYTDIKEEKIS